MNLAQYVLSSVSVVDIVLISEQPVSPALVHQPANLPWAVLGTALIVAPTP